jgi:hypothetical protein
MGNKRNRKPAKPSVDANKQDWQAKADAFYKANGINPETLESEVDKGNRAGLLFERAKAEGVES